MQAWTIRFVEKLQERMRAGDVSISAALTTQLAEMASPELLKCRDAALDLARVLEIELAFKGER